MINSDGKDGYHIKKGTLAAIMAVIALLSCIATVVAYGVTIKSDVCWLKNEWKEAGEQHPLIINDLRERIDLNENTVIHNQEKIIGMCDDILEMKSDIKELLKK